MKIYTKRGDFGETDLLRRRVKKNDLYIEVNGLLDEVMATINVAKQYVDHIEILSDLDMIHEFIFQMAFEIALDDENKFKVYEKDILWLEKRIDDMESTLEKLTKFIQLDQSLSAAWLNMARVKTRTAERALIDLNDKKELNIQSLKFMNRLSDYFFTAGRIHNIK